jgi:carbonic anhydrase
MSDAKFATAINCMDGRTQLPVIEWMKREFGVEYVDSVTEPGPVKILAEAADSAPARSVLGRVAISVEKHGSRTVVVVSHHDCAGNPVPKERQMKQLDRALATVRGWDFPVEAVGVWVDENWEVERAGRGQKPETRSKKEDTRAAE